MELAELGRKVETCRVLVRVCYFTLTAAIALGWALTAADQRSAVVLAVLLAPLGLLFGSIWRGSYRAHFWLCVLLMFYVIKAVMNLIFGQYLLIGLLETSSSIVLFFAAVYFVRWGAKLEEAVQNKN